MSIGLLLLVGLRLGKLEGDPVAMAIDVRDLGKEAEIPHGKVDFPGIIAGLRKIHYQGLLIIEREAYGPGWIEGVARERDYLRKLVGSCW